MKTQIAIALAVVLAAAFLPDYDPEHPARRSNARTEVVRCTEGAPGAPVLWSSRTEVEFSGAARDEVVKILLRSLDAVDAFPPAFGDEPMLLDWTIESAALTCGASGGEGVARLAWYDKPVRVRSVAPGSAQYGPLYRPVAGFAVAASDCARILKIVRESVAAASPAVEYVAAEVWVTSVQHGAAQVEFKMDDGVVVPQGSRCARRDDDCGKYYLAPSRRVVRTTAKVR